MKYKDLFKQYKKGLANDEEIRIIEQEIERYEAVEEFLSEAMDEELDNSWNTSSFEYQKEETSKLKKSVNNRLRKVVLTSVLIVVLLSIGIFYLVSPIIGSLYYNPNKISVGKSDNDISFDIYAISELNMPGMSPSTVLVDNQGFGKYNVMYSYSDVFTDEIYSVNQRIKRGRIESFNGDPILKTNMFQDIKYPLDDNYFENKKQNVINHLNELNPVSYVSLGITFQNDLNMDELYKLEQAYPEIEFEWAGIRTNTSNDESNDLIGIQLINSKKNNALLGDEKIAEKYPAFFMLDWLVNPVGRKNDNIAIEAQAYENHYVSLLKYLIDREDAIGVLEYRLEKNEFYKSALEYAENQGIEVYGVLVFGEKRDLLEIVDNEIIKGLDFNNALVSKRNIN